MCDVIVEWPTISSLHLLSLMSKNDINNDIKSTLSMLNGNS